MDLPRRNDDTVVCVKGGPPQPETGSYLALKDLLDNRVFDRGYQGAFYSFGTQVTERIPLATANRAAIETWIDNTIDFWNSYADQEIASFVDGDNSRDWPGGSDPRGLFGPKSWNTNIGGALDRGIQAINAASAPLREETDRRLFLFTDGQPDVNNLGIPNDPIGGQLYAEQMANLMRLGSIKLHAVLLDANCPFSPGFPKITSLRDKAAPGSDAVCAKTPAEVAAYFAAKQWPTLIRVVPPSD